MISGRVRALNLTVPLGSGRVGSDNLGYGPGSGFSFEPVQTSSAGSTTFEVRVTHLSMFCYCFFQSDCYFITFPLNVSMATRHICHVTHRSHNNTV